MGVLLRWDGVASEPLAEGVHVVGPLAQVDLYDQRASEHNEDLVAISADGAVLEARASVLTFHPASGEVVALAREVGPNFYLMVVQPMVRSTVRRVLAGWRADQLDTPGILRAQLEVTRIAAARLRPFHIVIDSVNLRTMRLSPSSVANEAVLETSVEEQRVFLARKRVELAHRATENRCEAARGVAAANAILSPTLTPQVLTDSAIQAWTALLASPSTTVEVRTASQPEMMEVSP